MSALKMGACPRCEGTITVEHDGAIEEPCTINGVPGTQIRPAKFYGCNHCEWCEEVTKGRW